MWVFTEEGFVSIVKDRNGHGMLVRARRREHLVAMLARMTPKVRAKLTITASPKADYPFRVLIPRRAVGRFMLTMLRRLDYDNFKSRVHETQPKDGRLHSALMDVWVAMRRIEQPRPDRFAGWLKGIPEGPKVPRGKGGYSQQLLRNVTPGWSHADPLNWPCPFPNCKNVQPCADHQSDGRIQ
jgi:hypothetical protein